MVKGWEPWVKKEITDNDSKIRRHGVTVPTHEKTIDWPSNDGVSGVSCRLVGLFYHIQNHITLSNATQKSTTFFFTCNWNATYRRSREYQATPACIMCTYSTCLFMWLYTNPFQLGFWGTALHGSHHLMASLVSSAPHGSHYKGSTGFVWLAHVRKRELIRYRCTIKPLCWYVSVCNCNVKFEVKI